MLNFDSFNSYEEALAFAVEVGKTYNRGFAILSHPMYSYKLDLIPYRMNPPIVMVERTENYGEEQRITEMCESHGGFFVGT